MKSSILKAQKKKKTHKKRANIQKQKQDKINKEEAHQKEIADNIMIKYRKMFPEKNENMINNKNMIIDYLARNVLFWNISIYENQKYIHYKKLQNWLKYKKHNVIQTISESGIIEEVQKKLNILTNWQSKTTFNGNDEVLRRLRNLYPKGRPKMNIKNILTN